MPKFKCVKNEKGVYFLLTSTFGMVNLGIVITKIVDNHKKGKNLFE